MNVPFYAALFVGGPSMITVRHSAVLPLTYPLERISPLSRLLFFDIETTGFSGDTSFVYLIGCAYYSEGEWHLIQWFADSPNAEPELLDAFFSFLQNYSILIHFNGDRFDIPFLLKRCRHLGLPYDFSAVQSLDIYRKIQPYRSLLGLESMKQKAIEQFLGIYRKDLYNGGQLIEVYFQYLQDKNPLLYDMLILHNKEDLEGMPLILPILSYCDILEGPFSLQNQEVQQVCDIFGSPESRLVLSYESPFDAPSDWQTTGGPFFLEGTKNRLSCTVSLTAGELKRFYSDYKDYYYLPQEDYAVHKSVGEFVDRSARKKASPSTCYTRHSGVFLPQPRPCSLPVFKMSYKDKAAFLSYSPQLFEDPEFALGYLKGVLAFLCPKGGF